MATVSVSPSNSIGMMRYICAIGSVTIASTSLLDRDVGELTTACSANCSASAWASCSSLIRPMSMATLPSNWPGCSLLLIEQQLLLLVGDEPQVDQDLSDASMCHDEESVSQESGSGSVSVRFALQRRSDRYAAFSPPSCG